MKVAIFVVEYRAKKFDDSYRYPIPREFRSECRNFLFNELIGYVKKEKVDLAVFPGGFFRTDSPGDIINSLKYCPPEIKVLVGWDNVAGNKREVWVVAKNGSITKRIPEAWISSHKFSVEILSQTDRRFQFCNKTYAAFCCGDILLWTKQNRKTPTYSKAAFVLAHYTARRFSSSMQKLEIPTFLSHHVRDPYNTISYAYNGKYKKNDPEPIGKSIKSEFQGLKWVARIYSI